MRDCVTADCACIALIAGGVAGVSSCPYSQIGGAVKNVIAIAAGMCEGLGLGTNGTHSCHAASSDALFFLTTHHHKPNPYQPWRPSSRAAATRCSAWR